MNDSNSFQYLDDLIERANKVMGKKLTTKDRKALPDSVYCGPDRSFPCHDCKHVAVAKAYLGRSKYPKKTKQRIAACINRRAKKLGCKVTKKAKAGVDEFPKFIELSYEEKKIYSSAEFSFTKALVDISVKNPGKDLEDCLGILLQEEK
jgi:hypothetical protein